MSIIRRKVPEEWRGPIYKTETHYEAWALVQVRLGDIHFIKGKWVAPDGMRFVNSQEASEYLLKMYKLGQPVAPADPVRSEDLPDRPEPAPKQKTKTRKQQPKTNGGTDGMSVQELRAHVRDMAQSMQELQDMILGRK